MAHHLVDLVAPFCESFSHLREMKRNARATAETLFDARKTSLVYDQIYEESV
jgi:hypothetical protein